MADSILPLTEFDANLAVIRFNLPNISDREAMSLACLDEATMLPTLLHLMAYARRHPIIFKRDMRRCQTETDVDPSLLDRYRPV